MNDNELDEFDFQSVMKMGQRTAPFDIEDKVMFAIERDLRHQKSVAKDLKISLSFTIFSLLLAGLLTNIISRMDYSILGIKTNLLVLPVYFVLGVIGILTIDRLVSRLKKTNHLITT